MAFEHDVIPFFQWFFGDFKWLQGDFTGVLGAFFAFLAILGILAFVGIVFGYLYSALRHGPIGAFHVLSRTTLQAIPDLLLTSPRRVMAVTRLAIQESRRNRVIVVFAVFALMMLLAGWFLNVKADHPGRQYLGFVLTASNFLVLGLALFLSAFSLPNDIKNRTIYTVVTKPVRASEIILGRILGFSAVGTALLVVMWLTSYIFVVRGLSHTHEIAAVEMIDTSLQSSSASLSGGKKGQTSYNNHHRHKEVIVNQYGQGSTEVVMDHKHRVDASFNLSGEWKFSISDTGEDGQEFTVEVKGSRRKPSISIRSDDGKATELRGVTLNYAELLTSFPGSLLGREEDGQFRALVILPADGENNLLGLQGTITWPDETESKLIAQQTKSDAKQDLVRYEIGPKQEQEALKPRVPLFGKLRFLDDDGSPGEGISVGKEWTYRQYIAGGSQAAGVWLFENVAPERFPNPKEGLPLELNLRVFRTHKGDITQRVAGTYTLVNPNPAIDLKSAPQPFQSEEFSIQQLTIPSTIQAFDSFGTRREVNVFDDLVDEGRLELRVQCAEPGQYFGMAQADVYMRISDTSFIANFTKGYVSIWLQMIIVICFGVMYSTFLSAAVATMATISSVVIGFFTTFISKVTLGTFNPEATEAIEGGGPIESMIRVLTRKNLSQELEFYDWITTTIQTVDRGLMVVMEILASYALPNFQQLNTTDSVAYGFNISGDTLATHFVIAIGFFLVLSALSYFFLKTREIAA